jgi:F0F1-type ATP synthase gamma subunit
MTLTKAKKKVINEMLLVIAEQRIRVEKEMQEAVIYSIAMRKVSGELEAAYQLGAQLLKPREIKKKVKDLTIRLANGEVKQ